MEVRKDYEGNPIHSDYPKTGTVRRAIRLKFSDINKRTYQGNICVIIPSTDCQFPDNQTGCLVCNTGINLYQYVSKFGTNPLVFQFSKVTITAGQCIIGIE